MRFSILPLFSIVILFFFNSNVFSQEKGSIEGVVTDGNTYNVLETASVQLLQAADSSLVKGQITDSEGVFKFDNVGYGQYIIRVSYLGYHPQFIPKFVVSPEKSSIKFGQTALLESSNNLDEVSVYAMKLTGTVEDNKTIYNITNEAAERAQSGLELLRQVPSCQVDFMSNNVTLEGSDNVLFLVNGKKVTKEYLMQLNPKIIQRFEIISNPGVEYESDVEGVISVVLKKNMEFGLNARASVEIPTNYKGYFSNHNGNIEYFKNGIRVFAGGYWGFNQWDLNFERNRIYEGPQGDFSVLNQYSEGEQFNKYGGFNYGTDWFINDKNSLNFYSSIRPYIPNEIDLETDIYIEYDSVAEERTNINLQDRKYFFNDYSLFYLHKFSKPGQEISGEAYYSNNRSYTEQENVEYFDEDESVLSSVHQISKDNKDVVRLKADYKHPLSEKLKFSVGVLSYNSFIDNRYNEKVENYVDDIQYTENRMAAYSNISWKIKKHNLQFGLRYENSYINVHHERDTSNEYDELLPFVSYQTKLGKNHTLQLNYRKSIQRPWLNQINPFNFKEDEYNISSGNPNLGPGIKHKLVFTHRIKIKGPFFITYKPYVKMENDIIRKITQPLNDSVSYSKFENVSSAFEYGVRFNAGLALTKWWSFNPGFTYYHKEIKEMNEFGLPGFQNDAWKIELKTQIILPKDWVIFANFNKESPYITHQRTTEKNYVFIAGFNKKVNNRLSISAITLNPWSQKFNFEDTEIQSEGLSEKHKGYVNYNYIVNFRVNYSFNTGKEIKKINRNIQTDEDVGGNQGIF